MAKEGIKTSIEILMDDLSKQLKITVQRNQIITKAIKALSNLKNSPIDEFDNPLTKAEIEACVNKCKKILADNS